MPPIVFICRAERASASVVDPTVWRRERRMAGRAGLCHHLIASRTKLERPMSKASHPSLRGLESSQHSHKAELSDSARFR